MASTMEKHPEKLSLEHQHGPAHSSLSYVVVWIILLILTTVTYLTGEQHFAGWALAIAMIIACSKAALVAIIFMHLSESSGATRLVFVTSLLFVGLLIAFTFADVATRFTPATPAGAPFGNELSPPTGMLQQDFPNAQQKEPQQQ